MLCSSSAEAVCCEPASTACPKLAANGELVQVRLDPRLRHSFKQLGTSLYIQAREDVVI